MGILGLSKLIADIAPQAVKEMEIKNYFGKFFYHKKHTSTICYTKTIYGNLFLNFQGVKSLLMRL